MADISIQFHASISELKAFVTQIVEKHRLYVAVIQLRPFHARSLQKAEVSEFFERLDTFRRWAFTLRPSVVAVANELEFGDKNPDHLRLDWGLLSARGLEQSWLSARTENKEAIDTWRMTAATIRRGTKAGVLAIHRNDGASTLMRSFRYTPGAEALEKEGVQLLPFAGAVQLRIAPPKR